MKNLEVNCLGDEKRLIKNVMKYFPDFTEDDAIDYINDHADNGDDDAAVYTGTYYKYNCGSLFGMWISIESFSYYEEFTEFLAAIHSDEEDPEFMHQDFMNFPESFYSESSMGEETFDKIKFYAESDADAEALEAWIDDLGHDNFDDFDECYMGKFDSEEDWAEHIFDECYSYQTFENSDFYKRYFDFKAFARDLFCDDFYFASGHVFLRN